MGYLIFLLCQNYSLKFEFGSAKIKPEYYPTLNKVGRKLQKIFEEDPHALVKIHGYTDNIGSYRFNVELSRKRAQAVKDYLVKNFKLPANRIAVAGFGPKNPIASNATEEGRAQNRRVEIIIERRVMGEKKRLKKKEEKIILSEAVKKPKAPPDAILVKYFNKVKKQDPKEAKWRWVTGGDPLYKFYKVATERKSRAEITFKTGENLKVDENSLVIIYGELIQKKKEKKHNVTLKRGELLARLSKKRKKKPFRIKTPTAELELLGGENTIKVEKDKKTVVSVFSGAVVVKQKDKKVKVKAGQGVVVKKGAKEIKPKPLPVTPIPIRPLNGFVFVKKKIEDTLKFTWKSTSPICRIEVSRDRGFTDIIYKIETHKKEVNLILCEGIYYWRVFALNEDKLESKPSDVRVLRVKAKKGARCVVFYSPKKEFVLKRVGKIKIAGKTLPGASVTINREKVKVDKKGRFSGTLLLHPGTNTVEVVVEKKPLFFTFKRFTIKYTPFKPNVSIATGGGVVLYNNRILPGFPGASVSLEPFENWFFTFETLLSSQKYSETALFNLNTGVLLFGWIKPGVSFGIFLSKTYDKIYRKPLETHFEPSFGPQLDLMLRAFGTYHIITLSGLLNPELRPVFLLTYSVALRKL